MKTVWGVGFKKQLLYKGYRVNTVVQPITYMYDISYFKLLNNNLLSRNNIRMAQKLSPTARRNKAARDKRVAMTPRRRAMKAENQRLRRAAKEIDKN